MSELHHAQNATATTKMSIFNCRETYCVRARLHKDAQEYDDGNDSINVSTIYIIILVAVVAAAAVVAGTIIVCVHFYIFIYIKIKKNS